MDYVTPLAMAMSSASGGVGGLEGLSCHRCRSLIRSSTWHTDPGRPRPWPPFNTPLTPLPSQQSGPWRSVDPDASQHCQHHGRAAPTRCPWPVRCIHNQHGSLSIPTSPCKRVENEATGAFASLRLPPLFVAPGRVSVTRTQHWAILCPSVSSPRACTGYGQMQPSVVLATTAPLSSRSFVRPVQLSRTWALACR